MEVWGWIVAYIAGFALIQLLVYRYLRKDGGPFERAPAGERGGRRTLPASREQTGADAGALDLEVEGALHCRHCGTRNRSDPAFTYCRRCVRPLEG